MWRSRCPLPLKVITEEGVVGYSAGPALGRERAGLGELLGPYLIGEEATDIPGIQQRLREMAYLGWRNHWIERAFWDIKGKLGVGLFMLLAALGRRGAQQFDIISNGAIV